MVLWGLGTLEAVGRPPESLLCRIVPSSCTVVQRALLALAA